MNEHLGILLRKYLDQVSSEQETDELMAMLKQSENDEQLLLEMNKEWRDFQGTHPYFKEEEAAAMLKAIWSKSLIKTDFVIPKPIHRVHIMKKWGWVAASIFLIFSIGVYLWIPNKKSAKADLAKVDTWNIVPGKDGAILKLADGSLILLDTIENGLIALQGGATAKVIDGALVYEATGNEVAYNTMSTPKGRQYHLILPDGTKVWLNSASSIRYPTVFTGEERRVGITGEAYFEVAKNTNKPFRLDVNNKAEVDVLGTSFNVNAYDDEESIRTTLLEGSIALKTDRKKVLLRPGQQGRIAANVATDSGDIVVETVTTDNVVAWRNGLFNFEGVSLQEAMRQLVRWYDIKVKYENNNIPDIRFGGEMSRNISLEGLLRTLEASEVKFRMEGEKTLVISP